MRKSPEAQYRRMRKMHAALVVQLEAGHVVRASRDEHFAFIDFVNGHDEVAPYLGGPQFVAAHVRDRFSFYVFSGGYVMFDPLGRGVVDAHIATLPNYRRGPNLAAFCNAIIEALSDHKLAYTLLAREGEHAICQHCEMPMVTKFVARFDPKNKGARGLVRILKFREIESSTNRQVWEKEVTCPLQQQQQPRQ